MNRLSNYQHLSVITLPAPLPGCTVDVGHNTWAYWFLAISFESLLVVLASVKAVKEWRAEYMHGPLMATLLRDSIGYFAAILAVIICNFVIWSVARVGVSLLCRAHGA